MGSKASSLDYELLDPGIREFVRWLREHGFDTTDSGDGSKKDMPCSVPYPNVAIVLNTGPHEAILEAERLERCLNDAGIKGGAGRVQMSWDLGPGQPVILYVAGIDDAVLRGEKEWTNPLLDGGDLHDVDIVGP